MNETEALLAQVRDVEAPLVASSIAPGWWLLALLALVIACCIYFGTHRWRSRLWQRQAKSTAQNIRERVGHDSSAKTLASCSQLARKVVLAVDQREQVASLHGEQWLEKLDDVSKRPEFTQGIGRLLIDQAYQKQPKISEHDLNELVDSIENLIAGAGSYKLTRPKS